MNHSGAAIYDLMNAALFTLDFVLEYVCIMGGTCEALVESSLLVSRDKYQRSTMCVNSKLMISPMTLDEN